MDRSFARSLDSGLEDRQLLISVEPAEALCGFKHARGVPAQCRFGIAPALDVATDQPDDVVHRLDDID